MIHWFTHQIPNLLAFVSSCVTIWATSLCLNANKVEPMPTIVASMDDAPQMHMLNAQVELNSLKASAFANRNAAKIAMCATLIGAVSILFGILLS